MLEIIRDTREQTGWDFEHFDVSVTEKTISTGDYTLASLSDIDENDTYNPIAAVERKSREDLLSSITRNRSRFQDEIERAEEWPVQLHVVVECTWTELTSHPVGLSNRKIHPNHIEGTISSWSDAYNATFYFAGDPLGAQQYAFEKLEAWDDELGQTGSIQTKAE